MPTIDTINGIDIDIYNGEHPPPHIHATYNEFEALIVIRTTAIYTGELPNAQYKMVIKWLGEANNKENALKIFNAMNPHLIRKEPKVKSKKNNKKNKR